MPVCLAPALKHRIISKQQHTHVSCARWREEQKMNNNKQKNAGVKLSRCHTALSQWRKIDWTSQLRIHPNPAGARRILCLQTQVSKLVCCALRIKEPTENILSYRILLLYLVVNGVLNVVCAQSNNFTPMVAGSRRSLFHTKNIQPCIHRTPTAAAADDLQSRSCSVSQQPVSSIKHTHLSHTTNDLTHLRNWPWESSLLLYPIGVLIKWGKTRVRAKKEGSLASPSRWLWVHEDDLSRGAGKDQDRCSLLPTTTGDLTPVSSVFVFLCVLCHILFVLYITGGLLPTKTFYFQYISWYFFHSKAMFDVQKQPTDSPHIAVIYIFRSEIYWY